MTHQVSVKEHQAFIKGRINDSNAVRSYNASLLSAHYANERKHCLASTAVKHFSRTTAGVCFYCGGAN